MSQVARDILGNAQGNLRHYDEWPDDIHGNGKVVTIYITDDVWNPVKREATRAGLSMSSIIRKGFQATLEYGPQGS